MTAPLITIGITAFNAAETIEQAVASAKAQDWENTEIIIVDDYSTDGTWEILEKIPDVRIFRNDTNRGVAASRNHIIREAQGELIAFFDDDDVSAPERIKRQAGRILQVEKYAGPEQMLICHTARTQIYPDGTKRYEPTLGCSDVVPQGEMVAQRILYGRPFEDGFGSMPTCAQMGRTSSYRKLGGFDEEFRRHEDTEFNVRAALAGAHFAGIADPLVTQHMTMSNDKKLETEKEFAFRLLDKHRAFLERENQYGFSRQWVVMKYDLHQKHKLRALSQLVKLLLNHPYATIRRITWFLPNLGFNIQYTKFHKSQGGG